MITILGIPFTLIDAVQIAILYIIIYWMLRSAKGSAFGQALMGVVVIAAVLVGLTRIAHLEVISKLFGYLLLYLAVSSVVIFQPEIRRLLPAIGTFRVFKRSHFEESKAVTPERLADCVLALAGKRLGALIAIERGISLRGFTDTGIPLDAIVTPELLMSIFTPPLPMHDGGLVIRVGRIAAAHCVFPVSNQPSLNTSGMRHRAAVGLSEETDALVIVVSEETGHVSIAHNGTLHRYPDHSVRRILTKWISKAMNSGANKERSITGWLDSKAKPLFSKHEKQQDAPTPAEEPSENASVQGHSAEKEGK